MTNQVEQLRAELTAQAEQPDFTVSFEGVRRRAGRQRTRRALVLTGVAVLAALALAAPVALLKFGGSTPAATEIVLPKPDKGWRIVDDPVRTGHRERDGSEMVMWFAVRKDGAVRLYEGGWFRSTGEVVARKDNNPVVAPDRPPYTEIPRHAQVGNWVARLTFSGLATGLYFGDAARIEFVSQRGLIRPGERTVYDAHLARLSSNPKVIAFWAVLPRDRSRLPDDSVDDFTLRTYDAGGALIKEQRPPPDPDSRFEPARAPRLGDLIRTGEQSGRGGEVVVAFHGRNGYAGLVHGRRDPGTGEVTDPRSVKGPRRLPFDRDTGGAPAVIGLTDGRVLVLGMAVGLRNVTVTTNDRREVPATTATWSEDPRVTVWWVVLPEDSVRGPDPIQGWGGGSSAGD